jgi:epoxyqueuosine reductase
MTGSTSELTDRVKARARALGFDAVGIARADEPVSEAHARYLEFVGRGMQGEMSYLAENAEARRSLDGSAILEGARSVVCVGMRYGRDDDADDPPLAKRIARYARGQDYHNYLRKKLRKLAAFIRTLGDGVRARPLCDVEPVLERAWAARSGLGFIGKNGLLITPGQGSFQLLGEVVTTLPLVAGEPIAERCGSCTRCLDACPTSAFAAPFVLDPRRCVAYLTIEARSVPPPELIEAVGEHLFGCDACQEVCPFNRAAPPPSERTRPFRPLARWSEHALGDLVAPTDEAWAALSEGTPLSRAGRDGLGRNAVLAATRLLQSEDAASRDEARVAIERAEVHPNAEIRAIADAAGAVLGKGPSIP